MKHYQSLIFLLLSLVTVYGQGFLKTSGKSIINEQSEEIILKGMGLGGWMLQEGYMLQTSSFASPQHEIRAAIEELIGRANTDVFYDAWLLNHLRRADIDSLAAWGFNSIRLPMHYNLYTLPIEDEPVTGVNTWLNRGFEMTDSLLSWCAANNMYLILDLHAAPGGQGYDKAISDYDDTKPSLWESVDNRNKTIALWRKLAEHYADEPWIGGYDLLNETNWNLSNNAMLKILYTDITNTIREVDTNHIIFIEGNWFANDFTGLTPPWDDNMAYSFHKYWSYNKQSDIQWMLNIRNQFNVPIWCGESGENSNAWFSDAIRLFEQNKIGWAWWPLKKIGSVSCAATIVKTDDYQTLLDYWEGRGTKPSVEFATSALMEIAEKTKIENCIVHKDVIDAMFRQVQTNETVSFKHNVIPGVIGAADYDLGLANYAYYDTDNGDYHVSTGNWTGWNNGWKYRNDGVDIEKSKDTNGQPYNVGFIEANEWLKFTLSVSFSDSFLVSARVASETMNGLLQLQINDKLVTGRISVPQTSGWQVWKTLELGKVYLAKGSNELKVQFVSGGFNINQLEFIETGTGRDTSETGAAAQFKLNQNYPNPFNQSTTIEYSIPKNETANLSIYNLRGQKIRTFLNPIVFGNSYKQVWNGLDDLQQSVASGIYLYCLKSKNIQKTRKMILIK